LARLAFWLILGQPHSNSCCAYSWTCF
jgi:hypothetical protein